MEHHFRDGFVVADRLSLDPLGEEWFIIDGRIVCVGALYIDVQKRLRMTRDDSGVRWVETVQYAYNCGARGVGNLYRYNSPHPHRDFHHVHEYDLLAGDNEGTVVCVEDGSWATLSEVIVRFRDWYYGNYDELRRRSLV